MKTTRDPAATLSRAAWDTLPFAPLESLEPRRLLSDTPLPSLADFEDPSNPALRITTTFGDIDLELFAHQMPEFVDTFISGLERGVTSDLTFFHRLIPGATLLGGLFATDPRVGTLPANSPIEGLVGSGRANTERTVAIAHEDLFFSTPFLFNLRDNSGTADPAESIVYGRVIDDRSWSVVQQIASLEVADLSIDASFGGFFVGSFHNVPVTSHYTPPSEDDPGTPITEELLARSFDVAIIKAPDAPDFYRHTLFEPEGFIHTAVREFIPIDNPHDVPVYFELNARYEVGLGRDALVVRGVIPPHSRGGATMSIGPWNANSAIRFRDRPFALELRSTLPLAATLSHYDLGSTIAAPFSPDLSTIWIFPAVSKATEVQDFLVWYNPTSENATVTVTLIRDTGEELDPIVFDLERYRRGGLNFQSHTGIPDDLYAVRIESTQPIIASRSHYALSGPPRDRPEGYSETGAAGAPSTIGIIPLASDPGGTRASDGTPTFMLSFYNPGLDDAVVSIDFYSPESDTPALSFPNTLTVPAGGTEMFNQSLPQGVDDVYSLVYTSTAALHASYTFRRFEAAYGGAVPIVAAAEHRFAEGFTDPARSAPNVLEESLYLFNPAGLANGFPTDPATVRINFRFTDGFEMGIDRTVAPGTLLRVPISTLDEIIQQANEHGRYFYAVEVLSDIHIVAQMLHTDTSLGLVALRGGGFALSGAASGASRRLDDPGDD